LPVLGDLGVAQAVPRAAGGRASVIFRRDKFVSVHMAPEVYRRLNAQFTNACDLWSVGCAIFEAMTLCDPKHEWAAGHHHQMAALLATRSHQYSEPFRELVLDILQWEPTKRPNATQALARLAPIEAESLRLQGSSSSSTIVTTPSEPMAPDRIVPLSPPSSSTSSLPPPTNTINHNNNTNMNGIATSSNAVTTTTISSSSQHHQQQQSNQPFAIPAGFGPQFLSTFLGLIGMKTEANPNAPLVAVPSDPQTYRQQLQQAQEMLALPSSSSSAGTTATSTTPRTSVAPLSSAPNTTRTMVASPLNGIASPLTTTMNAMISPPLLPRSSPRQPMSAVTSPRSNPGTARLREVHASTLSNYNTTTIAIAPAPSPSLLPATNSNDAPPPPPALTTTTTSGGLSSRQPAFSRGNTPRHANPTMASSTPPPPATVLPATTSSTYPATQSNPVSARHAPPHLPLLHTTSTVTTPRNAYDEVHSYTHRPTPTMIQSFQQWPTSPHAPVAITTTATTAAVSAVQSSPVTTIHRQSYHSPNNNNIIEPPFIPGLALQQAITSSGNNNDRNGNANGVMSVKTHRIQVQPSTQLVEYKNTPTHNNNINNNNNINTIPNNHKVTIDYNQYNNNNSNYYNNSLTNNDNNTSVGGSRGTGRDGRNRNTPAVLASPRPGLSLADMCWLYGSALLTFLSNHIDRFVPYSFLAADEWAKRQQDQPEKLRSDLQFFRARLCILVYIINIMVSLIPLGFTMNHVIQRDTDHPQRDNGELGAYCTFTFVCFATFGLLYRAKALPNPMPKMAQWASFQESAVLAFFAYQSGGDGILFYFILVVVSVISTVLSGTRIGFKWTLLHSIILLFIFLGRWYLFNFPWNSSLRGHDRSWGSFEFLILIPIMIFLQVVIARGVELYLRSLTIIMRRQSSRIAAQDRRLAEATTSDEYLVMSHFMRDAAPAAQHLIDKWKAQMSPNGASSLDDLPRATFNQLCTIRDLADLRLIEIGHFRTQQTLFSPVQCFEETMREYALNTPSVEVVVNISQVFGYDEYCIYDHHLLKRIIMLFAEASQSDGRGRTEVALVVWKHWIDESQGLYRAGLTITSCAPLSVEGPSITAGATGVTPTSTGATGVPPLPTQQVTFGATTSIPASSSSSPSIVRTRNGFDNPPATPRTAAHATPKLKEIVARRMVAFAGGIVTQGVSDDTHDRSRPSFFFEVFIPQIRRANPPASHLTHFDSRLLALSQQMKHIRLHAIILDDNYQSTFHLTCFLLGVGLHKDLSQRTDDPNQAVRWIKEMHDDYIRRNIPTHEQDPWILVVDDRMPQMSGLQFLRSLVAIYSTWSRTNATTMTTNGSPAPGAGNSSKPSSRVTTSRFHFDHANNNNNTAATGPNISPVAAGGNTTTNENTIPHAASSGGRHSSRILASGGSNSSRISGRQLAPSRSMDQMQPSSGRSVGGTVVADEENQRKAAAAAAAHALLPGSVPQTATIVATAPGGVTSGDGDSGLGYDEAHNGDTVGVISPGRTSIILSADNKDPVVMMMTPTTPPQSHHHNNQHNHQHHSHHHHHATSSSAAAPLTPTGASVGVTSSISIPPSSSSPRSASPLPTTGIFAVPEMVSTPFALRAPHVWFINHNQSSMTTLQTAMDNLKQQHHHNHRGSGSGTGGTARHLRRTLSTVQQHGLGSSSHTSPPQPATTTTGANGAVSGGSGSGNVPTTILSGRRAAQSTAFVLPSSLPGGNGSTAGLGTHRGSTVTTARPMGSPSSTWMFPTPSGMVSPTPMLDDSDAAMSPHTDRNNPMMINNNNSNNPIANNPMATTGVAVGGNVMRPLVSSQSLDRLASLAASNMSSAVSSPHVREPQQGNTIAAVTITEVDNPPTSPVVISTMLIGGGSATLVPPPAPSGASSLSSSPLPSPSLAPVAVSPSISANPIATNEPRSFSIELKSSRAQTSARGSGENIVNTINNNNTNNNNSTNTNNNNGGAASNLSTARLRRRSIGLDPNSDAMGIVYLKQLQAQMLHRPITQIQLLTAIALVVNQHAPAPPPATLNVNTSGGSTPVPGTPHATSVIHHVPPPTQAQTPTSAALAAVALANNNGNIVVMTPSHGSGGGGVVHSMGHGSTPSSMPTTPQHLNHPRVNNMMIDAVSTTGVASSRIVSPSNIPMSLASTPQHIKSNVNAYVVQQQPQPQSDSSPLLFPGTTVSTPSTTSRFLDTTAMMQQQQPAVASSHHSHVTYAAGMVTGGGAGMPIQSSSFPPLPQPHGPDIHYVQAHGGHVQPHGAPNGAHPLQLYPISASSSSSPLRGFTRDWTCGVCSAQNQGGSTLCHSCGHHQNNVSSNDVVASLTAMNQSTNSNPAAATPSVTATLLSGQGHDWTCPHCRWRNASSIQHCQSCNQLGALIPITTITHDQNGMRLINRSIDLGDTFDVTTSTGLTSAGVTTIASTTGTVTMDNNEYMMMMTNSIKGMKSTPSPPAHHVPTNAMPYHYTLMNATTSSATTPLTPKQQQLQLQQQQQQQVHLTPTGAATSSRRFF
jgi:hypothetical protein